MLWTPPADGTLESWTEYLQEAQDAAKDFREKAKTLDPEHAEFFRGQAEIADDETRTARDAIETIMETPKGQPPLV